MLAKKNTTGAFSLTAAHAAARHRAHGAVDETRMMVAFILILVAAVASRVRRHDEEGRAAVDILQAARIGIGHAPE